MSIYLLRHFIGRGGMGQVYKAEILLPRNKTFPVACKFMRGDLRERAGYMDRFLREFEISLRVSNDHPGLVSMYHYFEDRAERSILCMEMVEGCDLRAFLRHHGRPPFALTRYLAHRILGALAHIHEHQVLHRDISPSNVLLSLTGDVKVSDLGLAKYMHEGQAENSDIPGKLAYGSPESIAGQSMDARSDLYSFGALLYELLSGQPPFGRGLTPITYSEHLKAWDIADLSADIPDDLRTLAMGLLQRDPDERRPASASEARERLQPVDKSAMRQELAPMVRPIHDAGERARKRQAQPAAIGPISALDIPSIVRAAEPLADTAPDQHRRDQDATGNARDHADESASLSGPSGPVRPGHVHAAPTRRRGMFALAMAAMLTLGYLGHNVLDTWRAGPAPTHQATSPASSADANEPTPAEPGHAAPTERTRPEHAEPERAKLDRARAPEPAASQSNEPALTRAPTHTTRGQRPHTRPRPTRAHHVEGVEIVLP